MFKNLVNNIKISQVFRKFSKFYLLISCLFFSSCSSYKRIPYFQNLDLKAPRKESISNYTPVTIQPNDILGIYISSLNPEASAVFNNNLSRINGDNADSSPNNPLNPIIGYLVDANGEIQLPLIGNVKVGGFTTAQIRNQLKKSSSKYLTDPSVNVRIINFKVSVLGDVLKPDVYPVQDERITILEALTLAGDLNITAKRKNVILIREQNGEREYIPIDLSSKSLFNSPYYYLKSNDVIYVEPDRTKYAPVDVGYRNATLVISALSVIAIALSIILR